MLKVLIIENSSESKIEKELKSISKNIKVIASSSYKDGMKNIMKYGEQINLALLNDKILEKHDSNILDLLEINNITTILICENIKKLPTEIVFSKECIVDCIIKYNENNIQNVVNSARRILKNLDKNILVVEDSKIQLSVITKILKKMNLNVESAQDGQEALKKIKSSKKKFDLILTDYYMPNMDGLELTLKVREVYDKDELGIIILSSNNQPEIASQFLKIGANDFINKPYHELEVITRINANLDLIELFTKTKDMANKDFLTGAYNRRYFFETGNMILKKAKRANNNVSLAMIDIDKFKNINDQYGHDIGDKVICEVVTQLQEQLRESDLFSRFGGEEFCILIDDISKEEAEVLFEKIRAQIDENKIEIDDYLMQYTISIGVYHGKVDKLDNMLKIADQALYYCKENGRNQVRIQ